MSGGHWGQQQKGWINGSVDPGMANIVGAGIGLAGALAGAGVSWNQANKAAEIEKERIKSADKQGRLNRKHLADLQADRHEHDCEMQKQMLSHDDNKHNREYEFATKELRCHHELQLKKLQAASRPINLNILNVSGGPMNLVGGSTPGQRRWPTNLPPGLRQLMRDDTADSDEEEGAKSLVPYSKRRYQ